VIHPGTGSALSPPEHDLSPMPVLFVWEFASGEPLWVVTGKSCGPRLRCKRGLAIVGRFENCAIVSHRPPCAEQVDGSKNIVQWPFSLCGLFQALVAQKVSVRILGLCDAIGHQDEAIAGAQARSRTHELCIGQETNRNIMFA
jgi:hypothetical protein